MLEEGYTLKERGSGERDEQKRSGTKTQKKTLKQKGSESFHFPILQFGYRMSCALELLGFHS